jgi:hypothetical protein
MPRIAIYRESSSSGITHVMEGDEVGKRAKNVPKIPYLNVRVAL